MWGGGGRVEDGWGEGEGGRRGNVSMIGSKSQGSDPKSFLLVFCTPVKKDVYNQVGDGWLKCCCTSKEAVGLLGTEAQDGHLDFHTTPELC